MLYDSIHSWFNDNTIRIRSVYITVVANSRHFFFSFFLLLLLLLLLPPYSDELDNAPFLSISSATRTAFNAAPLRS